MNEASLRLNNTFQNVGKEQGFDHVTADFHPFKEFKASWERSDQDVVFHVTDYLSQADEEIMSDFAHCLFRRVREHHCALYTDRMRQWMRSPSFVERNRPIYVQRSRNLLRTARGRFIDLNESYSRLLSQGLLSELPSTYISWTRTPNHQRMGYCSALMRVAVVSSSLDREDIPSYVSDYVLYHELLHVHFGLRSTGRYHDQEFRRMERSFPQWRESEQWLKRISTGGRGGRHKLDYRRAP